MESKILLERLYHLLVVMCDEYCFLGVSIFAFTIVLSTTVIHLLAWFPTPIAQELYLQTNLSCSAFLGPREFMNPEWIRWVWVGIYVYQLLLSFYTITIICRPLVVARLMSSVVSVNALLSYTLGLVSVAAWSIIRGRYDSHSYFNSLTIFGSCLFTFIAFTIVLSGVSLRKVELVTSCLFELVILRVLVVNGLAALAAWTMVMCVYDIGQSLYLYAAVLSTTAQYIWLGIVGGLLTCLLSVQILGTQAGLEYTITPYILAMFAYISVIINPSADQLTGDVMWYVTFCLVGLMFVYMSVAISASIYMGRKFSRHGYGKGDSMYMVASEGDTSGSASASSTERRMTPDTLASNDIPGWAETPDVQEDSKYVKYRL